MWLFLMTVVGYSATLIDGSWKASTSLALGSTTTGVRLGSRASRWRLSRMKITVGCSMRSMVSSQTLSW